MKEADRVATRRKKSYGVRKHSRQWLRDLVELQGSIIARTIRTGRYVSMTLWNGKKERQISKLHFHPSHEWHQSLVLVSHDRIERALIRHTYASRIGYGQVAGALQVKRWLRQEADGCAWYAQGDIRHYYANISHALIRRGMERLFKDKEFIDAYMEPFERFAPDGMGIPLGIRPSQDAGNVALMGFDRFVKDELHVHLYLRYLDDFVIFGKSKGEVKRCMKRMRTFLAGLGFEMHEPKIRPLRCGLDFLGYVFRENGEMWWRKSDKTAWLRRRAHVTNARRLTEIDSAAWGMVKWGNRHCRRLFKMETGIDLNELGIHLPDKTDKTGKRIIDAPKITTAIILGKEIEVVDWVKDVTTSYGGGRYAVEVVFFGSRHKLIVNSPSMKQLIDAFDRAKVTSFRAVVVDKGASHYEFTKVRVLAINHRNVAKTDDGRLVYADTNEEVKRD